jgi:hypothetical protein
LVPPPDASMLSIAGPPELDLSQVGLGLRRALLVTRILYVSSSSTRPGAFLSGCCLQQLKLMWPLITRMLRTQQPLDVAAMQPGWYTGCLCAARC